MTYSGVLFWFLVLPIIALSLLAARDRQEGRLLPYGLSLLPYWRVVLALILVAVLYTTPWDNYLVATQVWWYDPALVLGITLGWVPLEEYLFFVLQPILSALAFLFLIRRMQFNEPFVPQSGLRLVPALTGGTGWLLSVVILLAGWHPGTYLALELAWALPPLIFQLAFGGDILWHYRRIVLPTIVIATLYLSVIDAIAISSGTWTINPELSTGILLGNTLPVEEALFFLLTTTLLVFGLVLPLARESYYRLPLRLKALPLIAERHASG